MKFLFNLQTSTLKLVKADHSLILDENRQFRTLGGIGFALDYSSGEDESPSHWIIFRVYSQKVKVIYKTPSAIYYQRELFRPPGGVIEVEFSEWDQIKK